MRNFRKNVSEDHFLLKTVWIFQQIQENTSFWIKFPGSRDLAEIGIVL
jgi:hypothetical protein